MTMPASHSPPVCRDQRGSVSLLVLLILGTAVMLAGSFVALMSTHRASGVRQTAAQLSVQMALAGSLYAQQILMADYAAAYAADVPQRYPDTWNPTPASKGTIHNYGGRIPATRTGLDWKLRFDGRVGDRDGDYTIAAGGTTFRRWRANVFDGNTANADPTRPTVVDSMDPRVLAVPLQYVPWRSGWFRTQNSAIRWQAVEEDKGFRGTVYPNHGMSTWPRWYTVAYYDRDFAPLPQASRDLAAYEARFAVMPVPLDGSLTVNFGQRILAQGNGGRFRWGLRNQLIPSVGEINLTDANNAVGSGASDFKGDAIDFDQGEKGALSYNVGSMVSVGLTSSSQEQAFLIDPVDTYWTGAGIPLAQQYGTALGNMLGAMCVTDGGATARVRKRSDLVYTGGPMGDRTDAANWNWTGASPEYVKTTIDGVALRKASAGTGMLTRMVNIALGQGWLGNFFNYDFASDPGSPWSAPAAPVAWQPGQTVSWQHLLTKMGFEDSSIGIGLTASLNAAHRNMDIACFALTPFGTSLDRGRVPLRNQGAPAQADLDCPWYINLMTMNRDVALGMTAGLTADWYKGSYRKYRETSGTADARTAYPLNNRNLLPIPPDKPCPVRGAAFAAKWNDGMSRTGADGAEAGGLPPLVGDQVLGSAYRRPPVAAGEAGYYFANDAFASGSEAVWQNPVRDELVRLDTVAPVADTADYAAPPYAPSLTDEVAWCYRGMSGGNPAGASGEDLLHTFVVGDFSNSASSDAHGFLNRPRKSEDQLRDNIDAVDERLAYQNDITAALWKTLADCLYDRTYGKRLSGKPHGYDRIEDVETVFLAYMGVSVRYQPATSKASTTAADPGDYVVYDGPPSPPDAAWPLGRRNQLQALGARTSEIASDRSTGCTPSAKQVNTDGGPGQRGYRNNATLVSPNAEGRYDTPGWPSGYNPTWAALSRLMEHRLNDVRMSLFGTPALDLNRDSLVDATTIGGSGVVTAGDPQLHFSCTGRWFVGRCQQWRIFVRAELWDRRNDRLADESSLEQVLVVDPDGNGNTADTHTIFSRTHGNPNKDRRPGPTPLGRSEVFNGLP